MSNGDQRPWYSYLVEIVVIMLIRKFVPPKARYRVSKELDTEKSDKSEQKTIV